MNVADVGGQCVPCGRTSVWERTLTELGLEPRKYSSWRRPKIRTWLSGGCELYSVLQISRASDHPVCSECIMQHNLYSMRQRTGSQWSCRILGVIWYLGLSSKIRRRCSTVEMKDQITHDGWRLDCRGSDLNRHVGRTQLGEVRLEMTVAGLDAPWETTTPLMHRSCIDGVIKLISPLKFLCSGLGCRDQSCMFCTSCLAVFPTPFSQLDLNPANLEATVKV